MTPPEFSHRRWERAQQLAEQLCDNGALRHCAIETGSASGVSGRWTLPATARLSNCGDPLFLTASLTKPLVAMATLLLIQQGELTLGDRVTRWIPDFAQQGKALTEIQHLLSHSSGLPDQLADNCLLRQQQAPLSEFVRHTAHETPLFAPGRGTRYSSMGFAVLGQILELVTGQTCGDYVSQSLLQPLGMTRSVLGPTPAWLAAHHAEIVPVEVPFEQIHGATWDWNSDYWRLLGAPWGGWLATMGDVGLFGQWMLAGLTPATTNSLSDRVWLHPQVFTSAHTNRLHDLPDIPPQDRATRGWGWGWRSQWPAHSASFGDLVSPRTFGHWGATGTLLWIDPQRGCYTVILAAQAQDYLRPLRQLSNAIAACWKPPD